MKINQESRQYVQDITNQPSYLPSLFLTIESDQELQQLYLPD